MREGGTLEYDETTIDSVIVPDDLATAPDSIKTAFANLQLSVWHVAVTVPDTTASYFNTVRKATQLPANEAGIDSNFQISKTVICGKSFTSYNSLGGIYQSGTFDFPDSLKDNIGVLPLLYFSSTVASDSAKAAFITYASNNGFSVNDESDGIHLQSTVTEGGVAYDARMVFDHEYLELVQSEVYETSTLACHVDYAYSTIGDYRFAFKTVTTTPFAMSADRVADFEAAYDGATYDHHFVFTKKTTVSLKHFFALRLFPPCKQDQL